MKKYYADRNSLNILRVLTLILLIVIGIALKYALYILEKQYPDYFAIEGNTVAELIIWSLMILFAAIYIVYILIILPLWYNNARYYVTDKDIIARTGVLVKNVQYMKLSAVQYTTKISAPLGRRSGFNFIIFNGYGGRLIFTFLSQKDSEEIVKIVRQNIVKREAEMKGAPFGKREKK
ncbi:MAG: PH domain-containing protein [Oscillospiraceae bacterium]